MAWFFILQIFLILASRMGFLRSTTADVDLEDVNYLKSFLNQKCDKPCQANQLRHKRDKKFCGKALADIVAVKSNTMTLIAAEHLRIQ